MTHDEQLQLWAATTWVRYCKLFPALSPAACPSIKFNNRLKTTAGRCFWETREIDISPELFTEYPEQFRRDTIPHEMAHQVTFDLYKQVKQTHGREWRGVMERFGLEPNTYHNMVNTKFAARRTKAV